ncbi:MAG: class I SAM-dependent methyltransferase [Rhodothermales bacterium]|nr:class I SAM-dependent methyltransferase [Rhodothermales bacterium]
MERTHDAPAIQAFFDGWQLYRRIIDHDYMFHSAIRGAVRDVLRRTRPQNLLDLGCGDGALITEILPEIGPGSYTGIDLSPVALQAASANLASVEARTTLLEQDFLDFLGVRGEQTMQFDAILAGYTLHHLSLGALERFFRDAHARLSPGGVLLVYDVFRIGSETIAEAVKRSHAWREATWSGLNTEDLNAIWAHVSTADFPRSESELADLAVRAGFLTAPDLIWQASTEFHRLYAWQKDSG